MCVAGKSPFSFSHSELMCSVVPGPAEAKFGPLFAMSMNSRNVFTPCLVLTERKIGRSARLTTGRSCFSAS